MTPALREWAERQANTLGRTRAESSSYVGADIAPPASHAAATTTPAAVAWLGGDCLFTAGPAQLVRVRGAQLRQVWAADLAMHLSRVERVEPGQDAVAVSGLDRTGSRPAAVLLDAETGAVRRPLPLTAVGGWHPYGEILVGAELELSRDGYSDSVAIVDLAGVTTARPALSGAGRPVFAPDASAIAAGTVGGVLVWSAPSWQRAGQLGTGGARLVDGVAFSPDGRYLAAGPARGGLGAVTIWADPPQWTLAAEIGPARALGSGDVIAWSPDSTAIALVGEQGQVEIWDAITLQRLRTIGQPARGRTVWSLRWSPDGSALAVGDSAGTTLIYAVIRAARAARPVPVPLPFPMQVLAQLGAVAAEVGARVPLSTVAAVLALLRSPVPEDLAPVAARTAGGAALAALAWPVESLVGVAALVAAHLAGDDALRPPPGTGRAALAQALTLTLSGWAEPVDARLPADEIVAALDHVGSRYVGLLGVLGPEAVRVEPALPVRLRGLPRLPPLAAAHRALLAVRLGDHGSDRAEGAAQGHGRAGISRRGALSQLVTNQLALPQEVLQARLAQAQLLYWTGRGRPSVHGRPLVIVLDNTPAAHGQVGQTLRVLAHLLGGAQVRAGRPCGLVLLGPDAPARMLAAPLDLLSVWTSGTLQPAAPRAAHREVLALRARWSDNVHGAPRTVLLTQPYLRFPDLADLVTVRVHYPGHPTTAPDRSSVVLPPDPDAMLVRDALLAVLTEVA